MPKSALGAAEITILLFLAACSGPPWTLDQSPDGITLRWYPDNTPDAVADSVAQVHCHSVGKNAELIAYDQDGSARQADIGADETAGERDMSIEQRLNELGLTLPHLSAPLGNYVHAKRVGNLLYLSGKGPPDNPGGTTPKGKLGAGMSIDEGYRHARGVGLVLIAAIRDALGGDLDRVEDIIKVLGMVNAAPEFADHPKVVNGCSDLFVEVFGERGRHARSAVGMSSLPGGIPVEIEVIVAVR